MQQILETASTLKYAGAVKKILEKELANPSDAFVKFFVNQIYDGRVTQQVLEQFTSIVADARNQFVNDQVNDRLKSALHQTEAPSSSDPVAEPESEETGVVTTDDEMEAYHIVRAIVRRLVEPSRVAIRDTKSYCGILLDDNNRKPICRLHFNYSQKYVGVFTDKSETRVPLESIDDIYQLEAQLLATVSSYEGKPIADSQSQPDLTPPTTQS